MNIEQLINDYENQLSELEERIDQLQEENKRLTNGIKEQNKDLNYWKNNAEEDYMKVPISVLRYISELEELLANKQE